MKILEEAGCFYSFCPLASIGWLHRKIKNSFHLVTGSSVCASFIQNAFGMMLFSRPRFATAVMEESDVYKGLSFEKLEEIVKDIAASFPVDVLFLWSSCPAEILRLDLPKWSEKLKKKFGFRVIPVSASGMDISFTDGEDILLSALVDHAVKRPAEDSLVLAGTLPETVETELKIELSGLPVPVRFMPPSHMADIPFIGAQTTVVFVRPYLGRTLKRIKDIGSTIIRVPIPFGAGATRSFLERIYRHFGMTADYRDREEKIHALNSEYEAAISGKSFFFFPDTNLELPLSRFLCETGGKVLEIGVPCLDKELLSVELETLKTFAPPVYVRPGYSEQIKRLSRCCPDLVISPLALSNYLIEEGYRVKLSMDFLLLPLYGFSSHRALLELFVHALENE